MTRLQGRYTARARMILAVLFLLLLYLIGDWATHARERSWLLIPFLLVLWSLLLSSRIAWKLREARLQDSELYLRNTRIPARKIRSLRRTSPHSLEIRFNLLWILALQGEEHEVDRFAVGLSRIVEAGR